VSGKRLCRTTAVGFEKLFRLSLVATMFGFGPLLSAERNPDSSGKRFVTVVDAIETTRWADQEYFNGYPSKGRVAHFSPNGKHFVVVLRKGNVVSNTNEFSMLLFETKKVLEPSTANVVVKMASSSNRDGITGVKWLEDNQTIVFLGERPGEASQVYAVNVVTRELHRLTNHPVPIDSYDITPDGGEILFAADEPRSRMSDTEEARKYGIVVEKQSLEGLLANGCGARLGWDSEQLFLQAAGKSPEQIPVEDEIVRGHNHLSLSPDGRYAVVGVFIRSIPRLWRGYQDQNVQLRVREERGRATSSLLRRYAVVDTARMSSSVLLDTPAVGFNHVAWAPDGQAIFLRSVRLPLDIQDPAERQAREEGLYDVEIKLPSKDLRKIAQSDFPKQTGHNQDVEVTLVEDINTPPRIYVSARGAAQETLLLDLNPQFSQLDLGSVEIVKWKATDGREVTGGLFMPRGYAPGRRYPLVLQTHGLKLDRFSMDGLADWNSGFAARALAAKGFVVLQTAMSADNTPQEGPREMAAYEGAIESLDARGLIDRTKVGIVGFSRTTYHVAYTLTHSKYAFAAAVLTDGMEGGYFYHLAFGPRDDVYVNGGVPFAEGVPSWLKNSPEFNVDRLHVPLRLQAQGAADGLLGFWGLYSALNELGRPVDLIYLPDAPHMIVKPWEQLAAQEGLLDWFSFWLRGEEDPDPRKAEQYVRWGRLRSENLRKHSAEAQSDVVVSTK
jgi:dipeptidyl aminopeptidase/acylaminoacyl peptidase